MYYINKIRILSIQLLIFMIINNTLSAQENWEQLEGPYGGTIISIEEHNNFLFAGTSDGGIYLSNDYGDNWTFIGEELPFLRIDDILYYDDKIFVANNGDGIYVSNDFGISWNPSNQGLGNPNALSLEVLEGDFFIATFGGGVFKSTNKGKNWTAVNEGFNSLNINNLHVFRNEIYAATQQGVYASYNFGDTWIAINEYANIRYVAVNENNIFVATYYNVYLTTNRGDDWDQADYGLGVGRAYCLLSTGPYVIAGRESGIYISTFSGGHWVNVHSGLKGLRVYTIKMKGNTLYAGTNKGVFYSNDLGTNWKKSSKGILNERIISIYIDEDEFYAGFSDGGLTYSSDKGSNWKSIGLDDKIIYSIIKSDNILYTATNDGFYRSSNNGLIWQLRDFGLKEDRVNCLIIYKDIIYAGTEKSLYSTTNEGNKWNENTGAIVNMPIRSIYIDSDGYFFVATNDKVYYSKDETETWQAVYSGMQNIDVTFISGYDDLIVAGTKPEIYFNADIYISNNKGGTWQPSKFDWQDQYVSSIAVYENNIFASVRAVSNTESVGVIYSSNAGQSWQNFNTDLKSKIVTNLLINGTKIYASSLGDGIVKVDIPGPIAPPELQTPENSSNDIIITPTLNWTDIEDASYYNIQLSSKNDEFDDLILDKSSTFSEYSVEEGLLDFNSNYFWRVSTIKGTRKSDWSEIYSFQTEDDILTVTSLLLPENEAVDVGVQAKIQWENLTDATDYYLQVSTSTSFTDNVIDVSIPIVEYNVPKGRLDYYTQYFWRVKAKIHAVDRDWSDVYSFTTAELVLNPPELTSPEDNALEVVIPIALDWEDVDDADEYAIHVSMSDTFDELIVEENVIASAFEISKDIAEYETDYFWRIKALIDTNESDWSLIRKFTTGIFISVDDINDFSNKILFIAPNPVTNSATIKYKVQNPSEVRIFIYNNSGIEIVELVNSYKLEGDYNIEFNSSQFPIGVYFIKMLLADKDITVKFNVVR